MIRTTALQNAIFNSAKFSCIATDARAAALSVEFVTPIAPGFEALVLKATRGIPSTA